MLPVVALLLNWTMASSTAGLESAEYGLIDLCRQQNIDSIRKEAESILYSDEHRALQLNWSLRALNYIRSEGRTDAPRNGTLSYWLATSSRLCLNQVGLNKFLSVAYIDRDAAFKAIYTTVLQTSNLRSEETSTLIDGIQFYFDIELRNSDFPKDKLPATWLYDRLSALKALTPESCHYPLARTIQDFHVIDSRGSLLRFATYERQRSDQFHPVSTYLYRPSEPLKVTLADTPSFSPSSVSMSSQTQAEEGGTFQALAGVSATLAAAVALRAARGRFHY